MSFKPVRLLGYAMVLASAVCFASYGVWARLIGADFGIFFQGWVRSAIILAVLFPIALLTKSLKPIKKEDRTWFAVTVLFAVFTQVPIYYAYNHLALGTANLIFYSVFLITSYIVGAVWMGEKLGVVKLISLVLALTGLSVTFGLSLKVFSLTALALAAFSGIASGGEISTSKKSSQYSSIQITVYIWFFTVLTHLPLSLLNGEKQIVPALNSEWFAMLAYAATGLVGFWLVIEGFKHIDASIGGLIGLSEIVFSICFGVILFGDGFGVSTIIGAILILSAAMLPDIWALAFRQRLPKLPVINL